VLVSGTPCPISGLKSFSNREYDKLILLDIICHGVPSQKVWQKYLDYQEGVWGYKTDKDVFPQFRDKTIGWKNYSIKINFENKTEYSKVANKDIYMKAYINNLNLRPSCYNCAFKTLDKNSDITLADFWGVENILPDYFDDKGTSLVIANSIKGEEILKSINDKMHCTPVEIDKAIEYNTSAIRSVKMPKSRSKFMQNINSEMSFEKAVKLCVKKGILHNNIIRIKNIIKKIKERL
jgi:coenzyme F420-reducing hydrogenase beta subunit